MLDDGATANVMLCLVTSSVQAARGKRKDLLSPRHGPYYLRVNRLVKFLIRVAAPHHTYGRWTDRALQGSSLETACTESHPLRQVPRPIP